MPHVSDSNYHEGRTLSVSPPMCAYPHVLFFLLVNTLLASLLSVSLWKFIFSKAVWARASSLGTGLVARIQCSLCHDLTSASGREPKSCLKLLQAEATRDHCGIEGRHTILNIPPRRDPQNLQTGCLLEVLPS